MYQRRGFFARLMDLWRGFWSVKMTDAEASHAEAVYHNAIAQRSGQYNKLKDAVGRLVYLRNRIEADTKQRQSDLELIEESLARVAHEGDDNRALLLIRKRRSIGAELERLTDEHARIVAQAEAAKQGLREVGQSIARLKDERTEMLARKAHAVARIEVAEVLEQSNGDFSATNVALDNVREAIARLEYRADLGGSEDLEPADELSLTELRRTAADAADIAELEALKTRLSTHYLGDGSTRAAREQAVHEVSR